MLDPNDIRFLQALRQVCGQIDGLEPTFRDLVERAIETGNPDDMRTARHALDALNTDVKDRILSRVHHAMATDITAILDALQGTPGPGRLH